MLERRDVKHVEALICEAAAYVCDVYGHMYLQHRDEVCASFPLRVIEGRVAEAVDGVHVDGRQAHEVRDHLQLVAAHRQVQRWRDSSRTDTHEKQCTDLVYSTRQSLRHSRNNLLI